MCTFFAYSYIIFWVLQSIVAYGDVLHFPLHRIILDHVEMFLKGEDICQDKTECYGQWNYQLQEAYSIIASDFLRTTSVASGIIWIQSS